VILLAAALTPVYAQDAVQNPPLPNSAQITGLRHEYQTWHNCGGRRI